VEAQDIIGDRLRSARFPARALGERAPAGMSAPRPRRPPGHEVILPRWAPLGSALNYLIRSRGWPFVFPMTSLAKNRGRLGAAGLAGAQSRGSGHICRNRI
jgi:hypothetical protein